MDTVKITLTFDEVIVQGSLLENERTELFSKNLTLIKLNPIDNIK